MASVIQLLKNISTGDKKSLDIIHIKISLLLEGITGMSLSPKGLMVEASENASG